jgi:hypothetical protein
MPPVERDYQRDREEKARRRWDDMSPEQRERQHELDEEGQRRWERGKRWKEMSTEDKEWVLWSQMTRAEQERERQMLPPRSTTEACARGDVIKEVFKLRAVKPVFIGGKWSYPVEYQKRLDVLRPYLPNGCRYNPAESAAYSNHESWAEEVKDAARPEPAAAAPPVRAPRGTIEALQRLQALQDRWEHSSSLFLTEETKPRIREDLKREYVAIAPFLYRGEHFDEDESIAYWAERR